MLICTQLGSSGWDNTPHLFKSFILFCYRTRDHDLEVFHEGNWTPALDLWTQKSTAGKSCPHELDADDSHDPRTPARPPPKEASPGRVFFCGQTQVDARLIDILGVYAGNPCVPGCHRHQIFSDHPMGVP